MSGTLVIVLKESSIYRECSGRAWAVVDSELHSLLLSRGAGCTSSWYLGRELLHFLASWDGGCASPGFQRREQRYLCGKAQGPLLPGLRGHGLLLFLTSRAARCTSSAGRRLSLVGPLCGPFDRQTDAAANLDLDPSAISCKDQN